MLLETTRFGSIEVADDTVISIADGIPGFPELQQFVLVDADDEQPFYWIQDVNDGDLAFLAVVPWDYFPDYTFTLHDDDEFALKVEDSTDLLILSLVTVDRDAGAVTANLLGPVVINQTSRLARQIVMHGDYSTRAPLGAAG
jgi:flagellar assembly factor FliW